MPTFIPQMRQRSGAEVEVRSRGTRPAGACPAAADARASCLTREGTDSAGVESAVCAV
jgi:hypothetical protein